MASVKRIGVLTGGGDSPGINAAIRAIVRRAKPLGLDVVGFRDGWRGAVEDDLVPLGLPDVGGILHVGGTILGTSRTNPFQKDPTTGTWTPTPKVERILDTLKRRRVDVLIPIGGDDTLGVAHRLASHGVQAVGIPQTIDNDIAGTDYAIGFHSALAVVTEALDRLHTTAHAHHRVLIVEVMGRDSGWIAILGGLAGGADVILAPEEPFSVAEVREALQRRLDTGRRFSIIVVAEGARPVELGSLPLAAEGRVDAFGHPQLGGIGYWLAAELEKTGLPLTPRVTVLSYLQRGGVTTPTDRLLATRLGVAAVEFAIAGKYDVMAALRGLSVVAVPLAEALAGCPKAVSPEFLDLARNMGVR
ncbi:MAG: 6-phosphofructokinase [Candidatus Bipolaricaulis sibiricus]|uniref:Pyrophosphate--fructose 6-phosphate 1-phosphotransferase n=1 Tax=Bipolaricaulis sibiricus TaxID=2501609 RepID=A0A410FUK2_BIPS1|nr:MAG: 6-phosphofructokinase [Candidatus Bipolaricaulis sibiricus]